MKPAWRNGLTLLLTAAILAAGYFGMDVVKALLPSDENRMISASPSGETPLLYVDGQEDLVFYPWTTYQPEDTVQAGEMMYDGKIAGWEIARVSGFLLNACAGLNTDFMPAAEIDIADQLMYQAGTGKFYLPDYKYTGINGDALSLDLVFDGYFLESLHVTPAGDTPTLSNDERLQRTSELEQDIQENRRQYRQATSGYEGDLVRYSTPSSPLKEDIWEEEGKAIAQPEGVPDRSHLLDRFWKYYISSAGIDSSGGYIELADLLYYGAYHMVFYEGEILVFFLPDAGMPSSTGLLLYINPQGNQISGFSILDLNA